MTDDRALALRRAGEALRDAPPGSKTLVHQVTPSIAHIAYYYDSLIARGTVDPDTGALVWEDFLPRGGWGRLDALFAAESGTLGDSMPPEAIEAGFADLETEHARRQAKAGGR